MPTEPDGGVTRRLAPDDDNGLQTVRSTIPHPRSPYHFMVSLAVAQLTIMRMEKCRVG